MRILTALLSLLLSLFCTVSTAGVREFHLPPDSLCRTVDPLFPPFYEALDTFWMEKAGYYGDVRQKPSDPDFHYWRNAHVLDLLLDAYERTGDSLWLARVDRLIDGIYRANGERWRNNYYDDMEWMALALLRASDLSGEERYYKIARLLWQDIRMGWNSLQGGGIAWKKDQRDYKNTPANMPASILASRFFRRDAVADDLEWALKLFEWQRLHLVDPETGLVWDGLNRTGDGTIDKEWKFSYCQGLYIGAAVELFRITGKERYLDEACRTADWVVGDTLHFSVRGILRSEGTGDGGLFKGIFVRYLTQLIQFGKLDSDREMKYRKYLYHNASTLISTYGTRPYVGDRWDSANPATLRYGLGTQVSGMMLLEAVSLLCRTQLER